MAQTGAIEINKVAGLSRITPKGANIRCLIVSDCASERFRLRSHAPSHPLWIVSNRKPAARKGKVQLIDASSFWQMMR